MGALLVASVVCGRVDPAPAAEHYEAAMLNFTAGVVEVFDSTEDRLRFGVEYRTQALTRLRLVPAIGFAHALNGANFVYIDGRRDFWFSDRWVAIPSFGLGAFDDSAEINLGNELEFRSGVEIAMRLTGDFRMGVAFFHLSNGGLADRNPGTEVLVVSICVPLSSD